MEDEKRIVSLTEVKDFLLQVSDMRESTYEKRLSLQHAEQFAALDKDSANALIEEVAQIDRVTVERATKIADILPLSIDEIRPIFAKERFTLATEELEKILAIILKYSTKETKE